MHIKPPNLIIEEGDVWDDLYDMVVQAWQSGENKAIFEKNFDVETWSDDFIILGFSSISLSAFDAIIQRAYAQFGPELVNMILHSETVGSIASVMAWGDVIEYSKTNSREESTDQKGSETFFSPTTMSFAQEGSTQPTTPSPPSPRNRKQKDEDSDSEEGSSDDIKHDSASVNAITYPQWLTELHISALGKGIEIIFTKSYNIEDNSSSIFPAFTEWNNTAGITAAYHGCSLDNDSFVGTFQTFVANGVLAIGNRRRYYSVTPATYWTNSPQYACIWPTIKANLSNWRRIDHIPPPSLLIVVSEPNITSNGLETIVIPQVETLKATEVCPSYSSPLTSQQYVNACRNKEFATRRTHPDFPGIESSDFVLAPLPAHTISTMQNSYLGQCIHTHTAIPSISILTAATANAIDYMNRHIKKIIIFGWGQGTIGDTDNINFGTAGIKEGESTYRE